MQVSAEIRWFWRNNPPAGFETWFRREDAHGCPSSDEEARTDVYFRDAEQTELGIKRRGASAGVEIKSLVSTVYDGVAAAPFKGPVEIWTKVKTKPLDFAASVALWKTRWLRTFDTSSTAPTEVPPGRPGPSVGCNLELTRVTVDGDTWWTIGFEAFGPLATVHESLRATANVLAARRPPVLTDGLYASYPAWLAQFYS